MKKNERTKKAFLYQSVAEELQQAIAAGKYLPGDKLPSERELMETYGISRITVRQAMAILESRGMSQSIQGKGSYVPLVGLRQDLLQLTNIQELLEESGYEARTRVLPKDLPFDQVDSPVPPGFQVLNILGFADDVPIMCYHSRLAPELAEDFYKEAQKLQSEHFPFSTFDLYFRLNVPIGKVDQTLRAVAANQSLAMLLHLAPGSPLIQLHTRIYSPDGHLMELKTAHYRSNYYSFSFTRQIATFEPPQAP